MPESIASPTPLPPAIAPANMLKGLARRLVSEDLISSGAALAAVAQAQKLKIPLVDFLIQHEGILGVHIAQAAMQEFRMPYLDLTQFDQQLLPKAYLKAKWLKESQVLPLFETHNKLFIAVSDPTKLPILDEIRFNVGKTTEAVLVEHDKLMQVIHQILQGSHGKHTTDIDEFSADLLELVATDAPNTDTDEADIDDAPIVRFVNKMLMDAIEKGASDLHFEPYEDYYRVRFRIDGLLYDMASPPSAISSRLSTRIKVMAKINIAERRIPQDGKMKVRLTKDQTIDMRVNTCPTVAGEKVVIRILDQGAVSLNVDHLGLEPEQAKLYLQALAQPHGMILVTGPTGSGKTVTLYTGLNRLNRPERNIATVEDPAEIYMEGINQVNVNPAAGLDFSTALRAFLRQDPDVIMVGEIRDLETAEIAVKAAQTGHLVLSTLHTNSAEATINRLINMGVAPFNLSSSINLIIAQRLMRKLCEHCKQEQTYPEEFLKDLGFTAAQRKETFYKPMECKKCTNGYSGRVGVYQVMPITEAISDLILQGAEASKIGKQSQQEGVLNLAQAAINKVVAGVTSLDEMERVVHQGD